ncbi:hypothetical protein A8C56_14285 [Niabella ginsenosidivorans]|uniref:histidine kinase n=2 Tax=Niabella ginsenosidivorans TaxID=1176587 RepID=A0A1A9I5L9_9BACT|nr:hypothetical protein A8C56_14285 [Niabella ginsenosidivorans]
MLPAYSQPIEPVTLQLDSLQHLLEKASSDTAKATLLYQMGDEWSLADTTKALQLVRKGLLLAGNHPFYTGLGYFYIGRVYMDHDLLPAEKAFLQSNTYFEKVHTPQSWSYQSRCWANLANINQRQNNEKSYIDLLLNKAIPLAIKAGDNLRTARYYMNVGIPFMEDRNTQKAISYFLRSNDILKKSDPGSVQFAENYTLCAKTYLYAHNLNAAKAYLDSAHNILRGKPLSVEQLSYYSIESMYYIDKKDLEKASKSIGKGLDIANQLHDNIGIRDLLYQKARIYDEQKNYKKVKSTLFQILYGKFIITDGDRKQLYHDIAATEANMGHMDSAYNWLLQYSALADSISKKEAEKQIATFEAKFNYTEKEKELLVISNRARIQRLIMWMSIGGLLVVSLLSAHLYRLRKTKAEQEVRSLEQQQQIALTAALLQGEEKERVRLARDLHDGLGGMLAGVKINLTNAIQDHTSEELNKVIGQLDGSVTELRRIARNMMPEALLRSGLETALADLCQSVSTEKLRIDFSFMNISPHIPMQEQIIIYRIIQELLANIVKHSLASEAFIQCSQNGTLFYITAEDNGKGINQTLPAGRRGIGLDNIQSRVDFLEGKMDFSSQPGRGTVTNIEIKVHDGK